MLVGMLTNTSEKVYAMYQQKLATMPNIEGAARGMRCVWYDGEAISFWENSILEKVEGNVAQLEARLSFSVWSYGLVCIRHIVMEVFSDPWNIH